jgi:hypothetical protein
MIAMWQINTSRNIQLIYSSIQRQTVISQFYQLDRLVVEGGKPVRQAPDDPAFPTGKWWPPDNDADDPCVGQANRQKKRYSATEGYRVS